MLSDTHAQVVVESDSFAWFVELDLPDSVDPDDNSFHLCPGERKIVTVVGRISLR